MISLWILTYLKSYTISSIKSTFYLNCILVNKCADQDEERPLQPVSHNFITIICWFQQNPPDKTQKESAWGLF